ncbi:MAG: DUF4214 domain-containing protein [Methylococcales bacterium]|nr:DUF4214 domain-containing protein [Methylococcales bacterium]
MTATLSQEPIFIHSLWRSGSTYVFNAFRRSEAGYWSYQEPLNEIALRAKDNPDIFPNFTSESLVVLRHPVLEKPYFYELQQTYQAWSGLIEKSIIYDDYFGVTAAEPLENYLRALISAAHGRPVIQECRTSCRIGLIKRSIGGVNIYLWRNPWDQWWSFKLNDYFGAVCQIILGAQSRLPFVAKIREEIGYSEFHHELLQEEFGYFFQHRLTSENSYLLFYAFWCLGLLEGMAYADHLLNIDSLSTSQGYRLTINKHFEELGINGVDFSDCNVPQGFFDASDIDMFTRIENRVYGLLLVSGYSQETIDNIKQLRSEHAASIQVDPSGLQRDLHRAREIALRLETDDAGREQHLHNVIGGLETQAKSLENDLTTSKLSLEGLAAQLESKDTEIRNATETLALTKNELNQHLQSSQSYLQASQQSVLELTKSYAEREFALNQQVLAGKEELRRLEQAQAQFEKNQAEQISLAQQEQENLKRTLEQREQAMATQLLAMQQQAEREKAGQEKSHREQAQLLQRQQDEREQILSQQLSEAHEELFKVQQDIIKREQLQSEQTSQTRQEVETLLLTLARREQEVAAELLAIQQQAELDKAQMAKSHSEQTNELHREHAARKQTLKQQLKAGQEELRNLQQEHLKREHVLAEQTIQTRKELEHLLKALAQREQEVALQVLALKEEAEKEKAEQARIHAEQAQVIQSQHSKREKALNQQLHTKQQEIRNLQKDRIKYQREMMAQLLGMQQQASQEKAEQAKIHAAQILTMQREQGQREQALNQELQAAQQQLLRLAQSADLQEKEYAKQAQKNQQEQESLKRSLETLEQELTAKIAFVQQQAELEKAELARIHSGQIQELNDEHIKRSQNLTQQLQEKQDKLHLAEEDRVRLEQQLFEQLIKSQQENESFQQILIQHEADAALQLLEAQQQTDQEKFELSRCFNEKEQVLQRQYGEQEALLHQQLQAKQEELASVEGSWIQRELDLVKQIADLENEVRLLQNVQQSQLQQNEAELRIQLDEHMRLVGAFKLLEAQLKADLATEKQTSLLLQQTLSEVNQSLAHTQASLAWRIMAPIYVVSRALVPKNIMAYAAHILNRGDLKHLLVNPDKNLNSITLCHTPIEAIMPYTAQSTCPPPASTLDEMLAYHDQQFILCAFQTLLGRTPDPEGLGYYLGRLRNGVSKMRIVAQLRASEEGVVYKSNLNHLDEEIAHYQRGQYPIIGAIFRWFDGTEGNHPTERKLRSLESQLYLFNEASNSRFNKLEQLFADLQELVVRQHQAEMLARVNVTQMSTNSSSMSSDLSEGLKQLSPCAREIYYRLKSTVAIYSKEAL